MAPTVSAVGPFSAPVVCCAEADAASPDVVVWHVTAVAVVVVLTAYWSSPMFRLSAPLPR